MDYNYLIIYKKYNGDLIYRYNKIKPNYKKGDTTSMGWKVVDIQYMHKGKIMNYNRYSAVINFEYQIRRVFSILDKIDVFKLILLILALYILIVKL